MKYQDTEEVMFLIIVLQLSVTVLGATQDDLLREKVKFLDDLLGDFPKSKYEILRNLDELYGSGDFNENLTLTEDVDQHMASSVEGLIRLYKREQDFVEELRLKIENINNIINHKTLETLQLSSPVFPTDLHDFEAASTVGLYRIQSLYNIPIKNFISGQLRSHLPRSLHSFTWQDCLHIADAARDKHDLSAVVEWIKVALDINDDPSKNKHLEKILADAIKVHDDTALRSGKFTNVALTEVAFTRIDPYNNTLAKRYKKKVKMWHKNHAEFVDKFPMFQNEPRDSSVYFEVVALKNRLEDQCQMKENSPFIVHNTSLRCHHHHRHLPHLRLAPVKYESLSEHPGVALFHDFLSDGECDAWQSRGRDRMKATPLTVPASRRDARRKSYTDRRTSKIRYVSHRLDSLARRVNTRISDALNFDLNGEHVPAENYQLMNYGIGQLT